MDSLLVQMPKNVRWGGRSAGEDPRLLCLPERQFVTQAPAACGRDRTRALLRSRGSGGGGGGDWEVAAGAGCWSSASLLKPACTHQGASLELPTVTLARKQTQRGQCSAEAIPRLHPGQVRSAPPACRFLGHSSEVSSERGAPSRRRGTERGRPSLHRVGAKSLHLDPSRLGSRSSGLV